MNQAEYETVVSTPKPSYRFIARRYGKRSAFLLAVCRAPIPRWFRVRVVGPALGRALKGRKS